ncbi:MAG: iron-sulfur cluster assembly scaffold protein [Proteobacteria bacterium]|nr:iron-sulfur cluster assembly scaffold protein [Pseudomonadota bacterium]
MPDMPEDARYNDEVRRRLHALPAWGDMPDAPFVAKGRAGDREQGIEVAFALRIERNRVAEARFQAFGCPHVLAAASWVAETALGLDCGQLAAWDWLEAARVLECPRPNSGGCSHCRMQYVLSPGTGRARPGLRCRIFPVTTAEDTAACRSP